MNIVERQAIEDLFKRLKDTEKEGGPRDKEAEALIAALVSRQPAVAYYLAQTVLVQQWALNAAHDRIEALGRRAGSRGFLSALFGGGRPAREDGKSAVPPSLGQTATTGFLASASNTALGVAGGFILADMLAQGNFSEQSLATSFDPPVAPVGDGGALGGGMAGGDFGGSGFGGGGDAGGF